MFVLGFAKIRIFSENRAPKRKIRRTFVNMETAESEILRGLNPAQREAVVNYDAPSLIIAGAGSGKTRVLTSRIAYMIEQGVAPFNILALTFTNKAAEQMRTRIAQMIPGNRSRYIRMGTFHSLFSRILRENAERIGFQQSFTIYEPNDAKNLLKTIVRELHLDEDRYKPNVLASRISYAKNCLVTPGAYLNNATCMSEDRQAQRPEFGNIYNIYCQRCKANNAMDFDDLLLQTNILLRDCPDVLARYQEQFQYILVDEYQDTNYAQYIIIRRLSALHSRVCVVGDDAQSIYSFRGAKIENILSFQKDYPTAKVFKLEQNYRSTRTIVEAANSVIARNSRRMEKHCFSEGDEGEPIRILRAYTDREEAEMVVSDLRDKVRGAGDDWSEAVILYRTNKQSSAIEDSLRHHAIPYRIYKGMSFYDHKEIRDMLGYLRLIVNPRDDEAFRRVVNYPMRGIGATTVDRIAQLAQERGVSMWEAVDALVAEPATDAVQRTIARKVSEFVQLIRSLALLRTEKELYDFGMEVASRSGILALYRAENTPDAQSALDNIEELLNSMQLFKEQVDAEIRNDERQPDERATVEEWLQNIMLLTDMDKDASADDNKVTLMTVHSAKGWSTNTSTSSGSRRIFSRRSGRWSRPTVWRRNGVCSTWRSRGPRRQQPSPMPRCVSSGATWSSRGRAGFCAKSIRNMCRLISRAPTSGPTLSRRKRAVRHSTNCGGGSIIGSSRKERGLRADSAEMLPAGGLVDIRRSVRLRIISGRSGLVRLPIRHWCRARAFRPMECADWACVRKRPMRYPPATREIPALRRQAGGAVLMK